MIWTEWRMLTRHETLLENAVHTLQPKACKLHIEICVCLFRLMSPSSDKSLRQSRLKTQYV